MVSETRKADLKHRCQDSEVAPTPFFFAVSVRVKNGLLARGSVTHTQLLFLDPQNCHKLWWMREQFLF